MPVLRMLIAALSLALIGLSLWQLEAARSGLRITALDVDGTPATVYRQPEATGPAVIVAHGFAGSRQLMEAFALTLAQAGYVAVSFDFQGHGRNRRPMAGDVTSIDGTTTYLVAETAAVVDAALALPGVQGPVALLGHSMATDILVRHARADPRVGAVVAVSMYSEAVTGTEPKRLLIVTGEWEKHLRAAALEALRLVDAAAAEGETVSDPEGATVRRAVVAPMVEHVGVLYSPTSLTEARDWLDRAYGRQSDGPVTATGKWIVLLLGGIVALAWPLSALLPGRADRPTSPGLAGFLSAVFLPAVATPVLLYPLDARFLPVLVADYLALHLLVYGALALFILRVRGVRFGPFPLLPLLALVAFGLGAFGLALDRYAASFVPHADRLPIVLALACGAVPFMVADGLVTEGGRARLWRRLAARAGFLASLGGAVALDFERLFFLVMILPVIFLFFVTFGAMGRWVGRQTGAPAVAGAGLGVILAWALGVSFPLIAG